MKIRSLTPVLSEPPPPSEPYASRRASSRRPFTERVVFLRGKRRVLGWALNISRGGLRAILDEVVRLGDSFEITLGDCGKRVGRVVWIHEEPDGAIVGVSFLDPRDDDERQPVVPSVEEGIEASLDEARQS